MHDVGKFFETLTDEYTEVIERCFPRYREMLRVLLDYVPGDRTAILDLGCGTGNVTVLVAEHFSRAVVHGVDLSGESLERCRRRLGPGDRFVLQECDMRDLEFEDGTFDLITSAIAVHHLESEEKRALFARVRGWLQPGGVFAFADQFRGATADLYGRHIANWKHASLAAGATDDEFAMWMDHQREHDHHDTLADQLDWLREAGFANVDCVWRQWLWAVVQARRE